MSGSHLPNPDHPGAGKRIFATADIGSHAFDLLRNLGYQVEVYPQLSPPSEELIRAKVATGIDALITTLRDPITAAVIAAGAGTLQVIAQDSVGVDNIDRAAASRYRIPFTNTPGVLTGATAEFALFMMGAVARRLWSSERLVRENHWGAWHPHHPFLGDEVSGRTVAVIGMGRIGRAFLQKCLGLDMNVLCYARRPVEESYLQSVRELMALRHRAGWVREPRTIRQVDLRTALAEADFVSLHLPLVHGVGPDSTYHLINAERLSWMKPTAYLINTARGPVVDEEALVKALREHKLAGAALDVFVTEPLPADSPLRDSELEDRTRLFHHFGSGARQTRLSLDPQLGMAGRCLEGLRDVLEARHGGNPANMPWVVNKEAFRQG